MEDPLKMLINVPETVVADALRGFAAVHPELTVDVENRVIVRRDAPVAGKVGLVSGGGSGHEPLHGGSWGGGCLTRRVRGRFSRRLCRTRCCGRPRRWTAGRGCCSS